MKKTIFTSLCIVAVSSAVVPALALAQDTDPQQCMECHEPADDWAGMSAEEILKDARAPDNRRHEDNLKLSDEQLKVIIAELLPE